MTTRIGSVAALWRFPVKSMQGEQLQEVAVTDHGVLGDRAYALIDAETGKVASAKSVKLFPGLRQLGHQRFQGYRPHALGILATGCQTGDSCPL